MRRNYSRKYVLLLAFLMTSVIAFAQTGSIKGKVVDETNTSLPGASVSIDGTTIGSTTDVNGNYTITSLKPGSYTLTAKFVGYVSLKKTVTVDNSVVTVGFSLQPQNTNLNEVVVVGYGTQRKKDLTGSVVAITSKDFNQGPITTPEALITGKVSGVEITSNGGAPGSGSTIRIRGGSSLNASNDPLIVIDGVPISHNNIAGIDNPLATINPNDIESFTVLKDASATAIYGSRASNGVIIITTKKGTGDSKLSINFSTLNSLSKITKEVSVLTAAQFRAAVTSPVSGTTPAQQAQLGTASTNWQNQIYREAISSDNNISFTGGIKGLPYRLSVGYLNQDGILKTDNLKRTTLNLNINDSFLHNSLKIDFNIKGTYTDRHFANQGAIGSAVFFDPTQPVYSGNSAFGGYFEYLNGATPNTLAPRNPLGLLEETKDNHGTTRRALGNLSLTYIFPFLKELTANATFGGDLSDGQGHTFVPAYAAVDFVQKGAYSQYFQENYTYNTDYYLKYTKDFKDIKSHLDVQAGYSYQYFKFYDRNEQGYAADMVTPIGSPSNNIPGQFYIESPFARLNYNFEEKYLLTATIRDDRSSRFGPNNRNGYFPAIGLAWRINEEPFLKGADAISDLKLRAGYGITGQQDNLVGGYFPYLAVYQPSNNSAGYQFGGNFVNTLRANAYNANLKWEETATSNIALDYGFLNGKISGSLEYYYKKTKNLLVDTPVPDGTNLTNHVIANIGTLNTKGIDFNVNVNAVTSKDFNWTFGYNVSFNKVTVTNISLTGDPNQIIAVGGIPGGVGNTIQLDKAGSTPNSFYVYQQVYGPNGAPLEGVYVDRNGNGSTIDDKYLYKQPNPSVFMGFNSNFNYKKWNMGFTLRSNLGNYVYNAEAASNGAYAGLKFTGYLGNLPTSVLKTNFQQYQLYSDYYVENASFLRMDNANLSYNFGKIAGVANLRVTANVQNVFIITNYTGLDPEVQGGIDNNLYPRPRVYSIGVNATF
jgi:TonB-linked SusC/RagA family outer membrane protein